MRHRAFLIWGIVLLVIGLLGLVAVEIAGSYFAGTYYGVPSLVPGLGRDTTGTPGYYPNYPGGSDAGGMMGPGGMMNYMMRDFGRSSFSSNGERIFLTGRSGTGGRISGQGVGMMRLGCANCHGADGTGGLLVPDGTTSADIRWSVLKEEGFTDETLERAITQGVDEKGDSLSPYMPRWTMDSRDLSDLVAYLKSL